MSSAILPIAWSQPSTAIAPQDTVATTAPSDFTALLRTGASDLVEQTGKASELLSAYALGDNISPHDLVMAMEQAKMTLQLAVEVRNRVLDAYQELTRLQI